MNIFRILGDLSHTASKCILIWAIHTNQSAEGMVTQRALVNSADQSPSRRVIDNPNALRCRLSDTLFGPLLGLADRIVVELCAEIILHSIFAVHRSRDAQRFSSDKRKRKSLEVRRHLFRWGLGCCTLCHTYISRETDQLYRGRPTAAS